MKLKYVVTGVVVITLIAMFYANKGPEAAKGASPAREGQASGDKAVSQKVLSFDLEGYTQKGTKTWEVQGQSAEAISADEIKLDHIIAKAYGEEAEAVITGERGVFNRSNNSIILESNVKALIVNSEAFASESIGLPASEKKGPVEGGPGKKKQKIEITCDGDVQFNYQKNQAYFSKNVKVTSEDGIIDADLITMNLDEVTRRLKDIVAEGNVKITKADNVTYSDRAVYVASEKKIVLSGKPKLVITQDGTSDDFLGALGK